MMSAAAIFVFFVFGTIVGSFLNVYIARHQTGLGYKGRSFCFSCGHQLAWRDLMPLISFFVQRGRCRYCKARLSFQYPLVELLTGVVFALTAYKIGISFSFSHILYTLLLLTLFSILIAIVFYDIRHKIIPNNLVCGFIALSFVGIFFHLGYSDLIRNWPAPPPAGGLGKLEIGNFVSGPLLSFPLLLVWFISKGRWIGFGDAKLTLGIGWLLGISGGFAALILSVWLGAFVGVMLIAVGKISKTCSRLFPSLKRITIKSEIPFAPFLILGAFAVFFLGISFADIQALLVF